MSKRLTLLTTLLAALAVAIGALFCTTAVYADETTQTVDLTEFFRVTGGEAEFDFDTDGAIKVTFGTCQDGKATIETKKTASKGTSFVWEGKTPANSVAEENGVMTFEFDGVTENSVARLTGANVTVNGDVKPLFTLQNNVFTVNRDAITGDIKLDTAKTMLVGVAYEDVTLELYHPFMTSVSGYGKAIVVGSGSSRNVYGTSADSTTRHTLKFLDKSGEVKGYIFEGDYNKDDWADGKTLETAKNVMNVTFTVKDKSEVTIGAPEYKNLDGFDFADYNEKIENEIKEDGEFKYISSSTYFNIPEEVEDYISSEYFSNEDLNFEIYYKTPDSSDFTHLSSTSTRFSLSKLGSYEFYVLATDPLKNALEIDEEWELKIVEGTRGFYDGTTLKVPVFAFYMGNRGPQVEAASSSQNDGFVGSTYSGVKSFTIKGIDTTTEYTLWYNPKADLNTTPETEADGWVKIGTEEEFDEVKATLFSDVKDVKFSDLAWSSSALTFKPIKTGSYAVQCTVFDSEANTATGYTKVINVKSAVRTVTVDTTSVWFEKNWKSVLFLGIAGLSLIGIIVLLFVKPKDEQDVMVKKS